MLTALRNADGKKVIAKYETKGSEIYYCPDCKSPVILNKGLKKVDYFRHKNLSDCENGGESELHMETKLDIYEYFLRKHRDSLSLVDTEYRIGRDLRSDVYLETNKGNRIAIEVQVSSLTVSEVYRRTELYKLHGIYVLWVLPFSYDRFYEYWTDKRLMTSGYDRPSGYYINATVKFKEYELGIAKLTFNTLTFWDLKHETSEDFYVVKLKDAFGEDTEYFDTDYKEQVYFAGKRLKTVKSIRVFRDKDIRHFRPGFCKKFAPNNSYPIPERLVMLFQEPKKKV